MGNTMHQLYHTEINNVPATPNRPTQKVSLSETFNIDLGQKFTRNEPVVDADGKPVMKDRLITAFTEKGLLTPEIDPDYKFTKQETIGFLRALENREPTYLVGHSGTGKTELVRQVAARLNYNVVQLNFDGHLSRSDLLGELRALNGATTFRYGLVPYGFMLPGTILLFDEVDACPPETAFVLQRAISHDLKFLMYETNELFTLHPQSCIVATANTRGQGDDSGLYVAGTNVQNFSFLNRFKTTIEMDYLTHADEVQVLQRRFPKVQDNIIKACCSVAAAARDAFKAGSLSVPLTTRDVSNWIEKLNHMTTPMLTAEFAFLNRMSREDATAVAEIIQRHIGLKDNDSSKYLKRSQSSGGKF